jgi:predicted nucleotidyltransferase
MIHTATIEDLVRVNRPQQFVLLERAAEIFAQSSSVTHLLVRGSFAAGTADRMSDLDFVIGIRDGDFESFARALDPLMSAELGALLPGWRDTIVSRMGGIGYVFLVISEGALYQIDIYAVPESCVASVHARTGARILYEAPSDLLPSASAGDVSAFIEAEHVRPQTTTEIMIEILVLVQMMKKRIKRSQHFVVYSETQLLMNAVKDLIKAALAPTSAYWGWYHLNEDVGVTAIGRSCLADLSTLISSPPIVTTEELFRTFGLIEGVIRRAAPEAMASLGPALEAYKHYLGIA